MALTLLRVAAILTWMGLTLLQVAGILTWGSDPAAGGSNIKFMQ
jgi:hypothetical protein